MARATAAKRSRPNASHSSTTSAQSAKAKKRNAENSAEDWAATDQAAANLQGWGLYECIDEKAPRKVFFEVMSHGKRFDKKDPDGAARAFVMAQNKAGDELAIKAIRAVFRSKAGIKGK